MSRLSLAIMKDVLCARGEPEPSGRWGLWMRSLMEWLTHDIFIHEAELVILGGDPVLWLAAAQFLQKSGGGRVLAIDGSQAGFSPLAALDDDYFRARFASLVGGRLGVAMQDQVGPLEPDRLVAASLAHDEFSSARLHVLRSDAVLLPSSLEQNRQAVFLAEAPGASEARRIEATSDEMNEVLRRSKRIASLITRALPSEPPKSSDWGYATIARGSRACFASGASNRLPLDAQVRNGNLLMLSRACGSRDILGEDIEAWFEDIRTLREWLSERQIG